MKLELWKQNSVLKVYKVNFPLPVLLQMQVFSEHWALKYRPGWHP